MDAHNRALNNLHALQSEGYIDAQMCRVGRDVIGMVVKPESVYPSISPDDGGVCLYWLGGDWSIEIDLFPNGEGGWQCVRVGDRRMVWPDGVIRPEMIEAVAAFSAEVERRNPTWRDMHPDPQPRSAESVLDQFLEDAHALHPGYMTTSGLVARLADAGFEITRMKRPRP